METHNLKTIEQLEKDPITKGDLFADFPHTFDFALPQDWLNSFADWCKIVGHAPNVTYSRILSTTVWAYPEDDGTFGRPVTCCTEVHDAYEQCMIPMSSKRV